MPIKEEHYHLRSTHTQHKENQDYTREEKQTKIIVPFDYKTHTHKQTNVFREKNERYKYV